MVAAGPALGSVKSLAIVRLPATSIRPVPVEVNVVPEPRTVVVPLLRSIDTPSPTLNTPLASAVSVPDPE